MCIWRCVYLERERESLIILMILREAADRDLVALPEGSKKATDICYYSVITILDYTILYFIISYCVTWYYMILYYIKSNYLRLHDITLCHIVLCHIVPLSGRPRHRRFSQGPPPLLWGPSSGNWALACRLCRRFYCYYCYYCYYCNYCYHCHYCYYCYHCYYCVCYY